MRRENLISSGFAKTSRWDGRPATDCGRRVATLYGGAIFACRRGCGLSYETEHEQGWDRTLTRYRNIRDTGRLGHWAHQLELRAPRNKVVVAVANRVARIAWAVLATGQDYRAVAALT